MAGGIILGLRQRWFLQLLQRSVPQSSDGLSSTTCCSENGILRMDPKRSVYGESCRHAASRSRVQIRGFRRRAVWCSPGAAPDERVENPGAS